jgi:hypothetical protein
LSGARPPEPVNGVKLLMAVPAVKDCAVVVALAVGLASTVINCCTCEAAL